jgi:hypothetical protein
MQHLSAPFVVALPVSELVLLPVLLAWHRASLNKA